MRAYRDPLAGMALVSCNLILLAVTLMLLAAQQIASESAAVAFNAIDRQFAFQSAEAALTDARQALFLFGDTAVTLNAQDYGALTGNFLPTGDGLQIRRLPNFQITLHQFSLLPEQTESNRYLYRVTAMAVGLRESTQVVIQADFIKPVCLNRQCVVGDYSRLAWRVLTDLPAGWYIADVAH
jgi:Tfp pilus assembly protein PilX